MLEGVKIANLALRFLLEVCALVALGYWGFKTGGSLITKLALGIGAPLLAAVLWGTFVAPAQWWRCQEPCGWSSNWGSSDQPPPRCTPPDVQPWPGRWGWSTWSTASSSASRTDDTLKIRFWATVGEEPEVELAPV